MTDPQQPVLYDVDGGVATITLNRPEAMNSLDLPTKVALRDAVLSAADDQAVRCVVLSGSGRLVLLQCLSAGQRVGAMEKVLFGSNLPDATPQETMEAIWQLNDLMEDMHFPRVPEAELNGILHRDSWRCSASGSSNRRKSRQSRMLWSRP